MSYTNDSDLSSERGGGCEKVPEHKETRKATKTDDETASKLKFVKSLVDIYLENIKTADRRYAVIKSLRANILGREYAYGLFDDASFDVEPLRQLPVTNPEQLSIMNDAHILLNDPSDNLLREASLFYYYIRPAQVFLDEARAALPALCVAVEHEDSTEFHDTMKEIHDLAIAECVAVVTSSTDDDSDVLEAAEKACVSFCAAAESEISDDLDRAFTKVKAVCDLIQASDERTAKFSNLRSNFEMFVRRYPTVSALFAGLEYTQKLYKHLATMAQLTVLSEIEKAIAKLTCSEDDAAIGDTIKKMTRVTTFVEKLNATPMFVVDMAKLSIMTQIENDLRLMSHRKVNTDKLLDISILRAAAEFIHLFKRNLKCDLTTQQELRDSLMLMDCNAHHIYCVGSAFMTWDVFPSPNNNTDMKECLQRAIYQTFQVGMTGKLDMEFARAGGNDLFSLLRSLMELYIGKFNDYIIATETEILKLEQATQNAAYTVEVSEEAVAKLFAIAFASEKKMEEDPTPANKTRARKDVSAHENAVSDLRLKRAAALVATSEYEKAVSDAKLTFIYPYKLKPVLSKHTGLKMLSTALSTSGNILGSNNEVVSILHSMTSGSETHAYIYDAMTKIAQWISKDCDEREENQVETMIGGMNRKVDKNAEMMNHVLEQVRAAPDKVSQSVNSRLGAVEEGLAAIQKKLCSISKLEEGLAAIQRKLSCVPTVSQLESLNATVAGLQASLCNIQRNPPRQKSMQFDYDSDNATESTGRRR